jgi:ribosomal protein L12E/L44/L45/RPP1/RPP2
MLGGAFDKIRDPDASGWEKFLTILTTLGMVIPTVISLYSTLKGLITAETVAKLANVAVTIAQAVASRAAAKAQDEHSAATKNNTQKTNENTASKVVNKAADHVGGKGGKGGGGKGGSKPGNLRQAWNNTALSKDKRFTKMEDGRYSFKGSKQTFSPDVASKKAGGDLLGKVKSLGAGMAWIAAGVAVAVGAVAWGIAQFNKQAKAAEEAAL